MDATYKVELEFTLSEAEVEEKLDVIKKCVFVIFFIFMFESALGMLKPSEQIFLTSLFCPVSQHVCFSSDFYIIRALTAATNAFVEVVSIKPKTPPAARQVPSHQLYEYITKERQIRSPIIGWLRQNIFDRFAGLVCCPVDGARVPVNSHMAKEELVVH